MLTRREVEGQLRSLHPMRQESRRRQRALSYRRRYAQIALAVLLGLGMLGALGASRVRSTPGPLFGPRQSATWGSEHVGSVRARSLDPIFPSIKRRGWGTYNARSREARAVRHGARRGSAPGY